MCARERVCTGLRMSLVTLGVTPGFALTIPGYQHRPPCAQGSITPFLTILPARHTVADYSYSPRTRVVRGSPYVLSRVAEVMAGYVAAELFLALLRLEPTGPLRSPKAATSFASFDRSGKNPRQYSSLWGRIGTIIDERTQSIFTQKYQRRKHGILFQR